MAADSYFSKATQALQLLTDKKLPDQGFAYLYFDDIKNIFDYLIKRNPNDTELVNIYNLMVEAMK
jgi:hypothetical protein